VELGAIRQKDEDYWDEYEAAPKAFVAEETGRRLWSTRFGTTTSVRIGVPDERDVAATESALREALARDLDAGAFGFTFRPVKAEGLRAASGATDFSGLFIGFSMFLIVSAALLVGLLFRLGVEQRASEIGLLLAVGYPVKKVRRRLLAEGSMLASVGAAIGAAGGIGYAALLMYALRTIWRPAVGSSRLELYVTPTAVAFGVVGAVLVVVFSVAMAVRKLVRVSPPRLIAGSWREPGRLGSARVAKASGWGGLALAVGLIAYAMATGQLASVGLAMGTAFCLLVSGLSFFAAACRGRGRGNIVAGGAGLAGMAARNSSWNPGRSILSVALVASACFMIVLVAANREVPGEELLERDSGTGGYALVATSDAPLHRDLAVEDNRFELGFSDRDSAFLEDVQVTGFRVLPGDDASCLNLYQPGKPRILGVGDDFLARGGFRFAKHAEPATEGESPWRLLTTDVPGEPDVVPAIADANSAQWILKLGLGEDLEMEDELGRPFRLRLVATLDRSIFQGELLIAESHFTERFPSRTGRSYFLVETPRGKADEVATVLERGLGPFGFDATTTVEKLASFKVVENTYLSTFQFLGGLGLLLGTVGLGVVLVRNVIERRGELATLRAFGFRKGRLALLILAENVLLLATGMGIGTVAALASVAPRMTHLDVPWAGLAATLGLVLAVGMLSSVFAVIGALRVPLLPSLKADV
jgi:ABC-type lipoprotein release transport system permease subunit